MTDRELKKLGRTELLSLLIEQMKENQQLQQNMDKLEAQLSDVSLRVQQTESIAETLLRLEDIFRNAQAQRQPWGEVPAVQSRAVDKSDTESEACTQAEPETVGCAAAGTVLADTAAEEREEAAVESEATAATAAETEQGAVEAVHTQEPISQPETELLIEEIELPETPKLSAPETMTAEIEREASEPVIETAPEAVIIEQAGEPAGVEPQAAEAGEPAASELEPTSETLTMEANETSESEFEREVEMPAMEASASAEARPCLPHSGLEICVEEIEEPALLSLGLDEPEMNRKERHEACVRQPELQAEALRQSQSQLRPQPEGKRQLQPQNGAVPQAQPWLQTEEKRLLPKTGAAPQAEAQRRMEALSQQSAAPQGSRRLRERTGFGSTEIKITVLVKKKRRRDSLLYSIWQRLEKFRK